MIITITYRRLLVSAAVLHGHGIERSGRIGSGVHVGIEPFHPGILRFHPVVKYVASCANPEQEGAPVLDGALHLAQEVHHSYGDLACCLGFVLGYQGHQIVDAVPGFTGAFSLRGQRPGQNTAMKK